MDNAAVSFELEYRQGRREVVLVISRPGRDGTLTRVWRTEELRRDGVSTLGDVQSTILQALEDFWWVCGGFQGVLPYAPS